MEHGAIAKQIVNSSYINTMEQEIRSLLNRHWRQLNDGGSAQALIIDPLKNRWQMALTDPSASQQPPQYYSYKNRLLMAILLHKYGLADTQLTAQALKDIDLLNQHVVLSDHFFRQSDALKTLLTSDTSLITRKPNRTDNTTFFRQGDVISIRLGDYYYCAYVFDIYGYNEMPALQLFAKRFVQQPQLAELEGVAAVTENRGGKAEVAQWYVGGLSWFPDPAGQVTLLQAQSTIKPILSTATSGITMAEWFAWQQQLPQLLSE
ncbi:hypothetical protein [Shewanella sp.]|uniref:hypothetical protein n=1 Tax=Shewanella sp. TaxID=50422 RepID=UPI003A9874DC